MFCHMIFRRHGRWSIQYHADLVFMLTDPDTFKKAVFYIYPLSLILILYIKNIYNNPGRFSKAEGIVITDRAVRHRNHLKITLSLLYPEICKGPGLGHILFRHNDFFFSFQVSICRNFTHLFQGGFSHLFQEGFTFDLNLPLNIGLIPLFESINSLQRTCIRHVFPGHNRTGNSIHHDYYVIADFRNIIICYFIQAYFNPGNIRPGFIELRYFNGVNSPI